MPVPHHDGSPLYVSHDAPRIGDDVRLRVRVPRSFASVVAVAVRSHPDREPQWTNATPIARTSDATWWESVERVANPEHAYRFRIDLETGGTVWLNAAGLHDLEPRDSDDFLLIAYPPPPAWGRSSVLYQVFPDRFARSVAAADRALPDWAMPAAWHDEPLGSGPHVGRQYYGGDLAGITERLDHLERLGVNLLYLTPIFPARSNHRYDARSFDTVDPLLGGDEALIELVGAAHERGIRVIGDLTTNHSGDTHEWFEAAIEGSPERNFYYWSPDGDYASWLGVRTLPKFDWASEELRARLIGGQDSVVAKWLRAPYHLDGWRIDVANMTGRYGDVDHNASVRRGIRDAMIAANPDTILLAESAHDPGDDFHGDAWHGSMTYAAFTRPVWGWLAADGARTGRDFGSVLGRIPSYTGHQFQAMLEQFAAVFPWRVRLLTMNALDTHDTPRFAPRALPGALPVAVGLSVALPGIPVVFAGDEFGLIGDNGEHARAPIPWDAVDDAAGTIELYATLLRLRRDHVALSEGGMRWLHVGDDVVVFVREHPAESVLVVASRAGFDVQLGAAPGEAGALVGDAEVDGRRVRSSGPTFSAWQLPGVDLPPFGTAT